MMTPTRSAAVVWLSGAALVAAAVAFVYGQTLGFGLLHGDDQDHVGNNPHLFELSAQNLRWIFANADVDYWRPLSFLSHALDFQVWGRDFGGHHLSSVILHLLVSLSVGLVAALVWRMRETSVSPLPAAALCGALAALVFAVHPQHVQSTAWIAERKGLLCALFSLLCAAAYLKAYAGEVSRGWRLTSLICFLLAMLSKPMAISLPFVLYALDMYPLSRLDRSHGPRRWLALLLEKWPLLLLAVLVTAYTYVSMRTGNFFNSGEMFPLAERVINAMRSLLLYLGRYALPLGLSPMYPVAVLDNSVNAVNLLPALVLTAAAITATVAFFKGYPAALAAVLIYLAWLLPVSGIVSSGPQSSADRYAYLPGAMLSIALAMLLVRFALRARQAVALRTVVLLLAVCWLGFLTVTAHQYVRAFSSDSASEQLVKHYFPEWQPFTNYIAGVEALQRGELALAEQQLQAAVRFNQARARALLQLATLKQRQGANGIALEYAQRALATAPHDAYVVQFAAQVLLQLNRAGEARTLLAGLLERFPEEPELERRLAQAELSLGRTDAAAAILDRQLERLPEAPAALLLRAVVAQVAGDKALAVSLYERILARDPTNKDALHNLELLEP